MPKVLWWKSHGINGKRHGTFGNFGIFALLAQVATPLALCPITFRSRGRIRLREELLQAINRCGLRSYRAR